MRYGFAALVAIALLAMVILPSGYAQTDIGRTAQYLPLVYKSLPSGMPTSPSTTTVTLPPTATVPPTATATRVPGAAIGVRSSKGFFSSSSFYHVIGELENLGSVPLFHAEITTSFYDPNDQLVAVDKEYALLERVDVGERVPFRILLSGAPSTIARYTLSVDVDRSSSVDYRSITVLSADARDNQGPEIFGEIQNNHTVTLGGIEIVVTFYDQSGQVIEVENDYLSSALAPGANASYRIATFANNLSYHTYRVQVEGHVN